MLLSQAYAILTPEAGRGRAEPHSRRKRKWALPIVAAGFGAEPHSRRKRKWALPIVAAGFGAEPHLDEGE